MSNGNHSPTKDWRWPEGTPEVGPPLGCAVCKRPTCDHVFAELGRLASEAQRATRDRDELLAALEVCHPRHDFSLKCDFCALIARIKAGK